MNLPGKLDHLRETASGRDWLRQLPAATDACVARWSLELDDPFPDSYVSLTSPGRDGDGNPVVLKIQYPHRESSTEALALQTWSGRGAVRLIDHDPEHHALLLERCEPGKPLALRSADYAIDVITGLLPRLWVPAGHGFGSLSDEVARWVRNMPVSWRETGRPFEQSLLDDAAVVLTELADTQGEQVLANLDLHGWNILTAQREPWLVIDPKPIVGEREFGISSVVRAYELGDTRADACYRLDRLTGALGLDRERSRLWAFGQSLAWCFEDEKVVPQLVEMARWLRT